MCAAAGLIPASGWSSRSSRCSIPDTNEKGRSAEARSFMKKVTSPACDRTKERNELVNVQDTLAAEISAETESWLGMNRSRPDFQERRAILATVGAWESVTGIIPSEVAHLILVHAIDLKSQDKAKFLNAWELVKPKLCAHGMGPEFTRAVEKQRKRSGLPLQSTIQLLTHLGEIWSEKAILTQLPLKTFSDTFNELWTLSDQYRQFRPL